MADPLYLSLWFPNLELDELLPRTLTVMQQFPFFCAKSRDQLRVLASSFVERSYRP